MDEWINTMWSVHTIEYHSVLKRKEILRHATMWVNFEDMLSEINQTQQDKYCMIPLHEVPRVAKFVKTESRMVVARAWVWEARGSNGDLLLNGYKVSVWEDEKILEMDGGDGCTTM